MKLLFTEGIGASQTTTNAQDEKIPVHETKTAAENDLANLEVGQIIATNDKGGELSNPVDVVQDGNMHAVTSNAVAESVADRVSKIKNRVTGTLSPKHDYAEFDLKLLENNICNVYIFGNANKVYLGKFNVAKYNDDYNIVLYYGPNLTVSLVGNKVRVACSDGCYGATIYYVDMNETERILQ